MNFLYRQVNLMFLIIVLAFLYLQLTVWQNVWFGWVLFWLYLIVVGRFWQTILKKTLSFSKKLLINKILAIWVGWLLLSFICAICVVYYTLSPSIIFGCLVANAFLVVILSAFVNKIRNNSPVVTVEKNEGQIIFPRRWLIVGLFFVVWAFALSLLIVTLRGETVGFSTWQFISQYFLPLFFCLMIVCGILLFSRFKSQTILICFIFLSVLLHLYLPLSHTNPWGGDVWRHLANEKQIQSGQLVMPVLFGPEAKWHEVVNIDLPEAFLIPQKYNYGQLWGASVLLSEILRVDLIAINKWLMPIMFSILLPILLFKIGRILFGSRRKALLMVWLSFIFFPFQALGALTLPVSLGFLGFLFTLMLWLEYWQEGEKRQKNLALLFSFLMIFGYSLYFIVLWFLIICSWLLKKFSCNYKPLVCNRWRERWSFISIFILSIFIFPILEMVSKISFIQSQIDWYSNLKQLLGQFSGWFYVSAIRPHDILSGNIFFNHTPDYAFVQNIFNSWRWWLLPVMLIVWLLIFFGFYKIVNKKEIEWRVFSLLSGMIGGGYIIGWFILAGDRLFTRRLDMLLAFLLLVLLSYSLQLITYSLKAFNKAYSAKFIVILFIIAVSWFSTFTYASGPDMRVVNKDELAVANYINDGLCDTGYVLRDMCILADTWILLPLEGLSNGKIVGGGFPIDYQFGQKERVDLLNKFSTSPQIEDLTKMTQLTGANDCWFIQNTNLVDKDKIGEIISGGYHQEGDLFVWHWLPKTE